MRYDIPAAVAEIAQWQSGVISRKQLLDAGLSAQLITRRLERQRWQQLYRGVYAVFTVPPPRAAWLWAAVLRAGPGAVLSHLTAAELHGLDRKSTRLNSSHVEISYAVFCLKKKKRFEHQDRFAGAIHQTNIE